MSLKEVRGIYGFGEKTVSDLRVNHNIKSIKSLRDYVRKFPNIINRRQKVGLTFHSKINHPIPLKEAERHVAIINKYVKGVTVAGSIRRKRPLIGDIDLIVLKDINKVVDLLKQKGYIQSDLNLGNTRYSGIGKLPNENKYRKIDIVKTTKESFPFTLLYFTGDYIQNITMRKKAKKQNLTLNMYGLYSKSGRPVKLKSEKEIFKYLSIPYKSPEERVHKKIKKIKK